MNTQDQSAPNSPSRHEGNSVDSPRLRWMNAATSGLILVGLVAFFVLVAALAYFEWLDIVDPWISATSGTWLFGVRRPEWELCRRALLVLFSPANHSDSSGLARSFALSFSRVAAARRIPVLPQVLQRNSGFLARARHARGNDRKIRPSGRACHHLVQDSTSHSVSKIHAHLDRALGLRLDPR